MGLPATRTLAYFRSECVRFWKMMGENKWTVEQLDTAFGGIFFLSCNLDDDPNGEADKHWSMVWAQWERVRVYRSMKELSDAMEVA